MAGPSQVAKGCGGILFKAASNLKRQAVELLLAVWASLVVFFATSRVILGQTAASAHQSIRLCLLEQVRAVSLLSQYLAWPLFL